MGDADIFWETDREGFVVVESEGEVVGTRSTVSYGDFGFMGFFIVKKALRGQGIGTGFWHWRKETLKQRLNPGSSIGMEGVFDMLQFYTKVGFKFTHRDLRMEGVGQSSRPDGYLSELSKVPFEKVASYDKRCFGFDRSRFLIRWIDPTHGLALGAFDGRQFLGYGVVRQCVTGYKVGPLFAETPSVAETIFKGLSDRVSGAPIYLDVPENNVSAIALASKYALKEVFGCARMYAGQVPELPWNNIYGVTTFELG